MFKPKNNPALGPGEEEGRAPSLSRSSASSFQLPADGECSQSSPRDEILCLATHTHGRELARAAGETKVSPNHILPPCSAARCDPPEPCPKIPLAPAFPEAVLTPLSVCHRAGATSQPCHHARSLRGLMPPTQQEFIARLVSVCPADPPGRAGPQHRAPSNPPEL